MTVGLLPGPGGLLLVRVGDHDGGVEVHHHLPVAVRLLSPLPAGGGRAALGRGAGQLPRPRPGLAPRRPHRGQRRLPRGGQGVHQPGHRRVRGHRPEHPRPGPQRRQIRRAVPAGGQHDPQIQHHLPRSCRAWALRHRANLVDSSRSSPTTAAGLGQQHRPGQTDQPFGVDSHRVSGGGENYHDGRRYASPVQCLPVRRSWTFDKPKFPLQDRHFRAFTPRVTAPGAKGRGYGALD